MIMRCIKAWAEELLFSRYKNLSHHLLSNFREDLHCAIIRLVNAVFQMPFGVLRAKLSGAEPGHYNGNQYLQGFSHGIRLRP